MLTKAKNSKKQGDIGMGIAIGYFSKKGYTVCIPITDSQDYDLIVEIDGTLSKIQVKTTYSKAPSGNYKVALRTCGGNKSGNNIKFFNNKIIDYLFIVTNDEDKYLIPAYEIKVANVLTLNQENLKYLVK